ncbi:MAG TPA: amino acid ABC transporter permease, partial [Allosphingosinicella sp.]
MRMTRIERSGDSRQPATRGRMGAGLGLLVLGGLMVLLWPAFDWAVTSAFWLGEGPQACPDKSGACWPFIRERFGQIMYGAYPEAERWRVNLGLGLGALLLVPLILLPLRRKAVWIGGFLLLYPMAALALFAGGVFGLEPVGTSAWGGLFLTIVVGLFAFTAAFPMGILLALGRQSPIPVVRLLAGIWVEFWRGVPTLVVLFVAVIMLPLFLPVEREIDKLARALIALSILMSCYVGESIRGALRSVPRGQYEAARALGMSYWRAHVHVILPQAIRVATPQITNIVI